MAASIHREIEQQQMQSAQRVRDRESFDLKVLGPTESASIVYYSIPKIQLMFLKIV